MITQKIFKAQASNKPVPEITIIIIDEFPQTESLKYSADIFELEAQNLSDILCRSLPGGTLDRLIAELLKRKASSLVVPLFK
jgi:hypothetical protein